MLSRYVFHFYTSTYLNCIDHRNYEIRQYELWRLGSVVYIESNITRKRSLSPSSRYTQGFVLSNCWVFRTRNPFCGGCAFEITLISSFDQQDNNRARFLNSLIQRTAVTPLCGFAHVTHRPSLKELKRLIAFIVMTPSQIGVRLSTHRADQSRDPRLTWRH